MTASKTTLPLLVFIVMISILVLPNCPAIAGPNGLTMKLIHRDSIESPLYPGNLTRDESILRQVEESKARFRYLRSTESIDQKTKITNQTDSIGPDAARLMTVFEGIYYMSLVGFGTFRSHPGYKNYFLMVDSGSDLIWTQCFNCSPCFHQTEPYFPYQNSTSYKPLPCNRHPLCDRGRCRGNDCAYEEFYGPGSITRGVLANEVLTVYSNRGVAEKIISVAIGCGLDQRNFGPMQRPGHINQITGILGIGRGPRSFVTQLGYRGDGRFAYCLQPWNDGSGHPVTYLRFGEDATIGGRVQSTRILSSPRFPSFYYLELLDLSIGSRRLYFPRDTFDFKVDLHSGHLVGGCFIDSGNPWSLFRGLIYDTFRGYVQMHFANFTQWVGYDHRFELCYHKPRGFNNFPGITFHFRGADFRVDPVAGFYVTNNAFCLAFGRAPDITFDAIIGARQMTNHRILHDVKNSVFYFAEEVCGHGT